MYGGINYKLCDYDYYIYYIMCILIMMGKFCQVYSVILYKTSVFRSHP